MKTLNLSDKEIRKNELLKHIEKYKTVDGMTNINQQLYQSILKHDKSLLSLVRDLGIKWNDVSNFTPTNYYKDFENFKSKINEFIGVNGRFPTKVEIIKELKIQQRNIDFHGGMYEIKRKINYISNNDLVDENGFENNSRLELIVAQFFIRNKIPYKREQHPFPKKEGQFRSDFMIEVKNNEKFYVELWGYSKKDGNGLTRSYNNKREIKTNLYKKYALNLISLEYDEMNYQNLAELQKYLISKFSILKGYEFKIVDNQYLCSPKKLSDEEIFKTIMEYSDDENFLPHQKILLDNGLSYYLNEIRRRHKTYLNFAKKFGKTNLNRNHEWNDIVVFDAMNDIVSKGLPINRKVLESLSYGGIFTYINKYQKSSLLKYKLSYFTKFIDEINFVHDYDLKFLNNVMNNKGENIKNKVTPEQQEQAKQILEKYNINILNTSPLG